MRTIRIPGTLMERLVVLSIVLTLVAFVLSSKLSGDACDMYKYSRLLDTPAHCLEKLMRK